MKAICDWIDALPLNTTEATIFAVLLCVIMFYPYADVFIKGLRTILRYGIDKAEIRADEKLRKLRMEKRLREAGEGKP